MESARLYLSKKWPPIFCIPCRRERIKRPFPRKCEHVWDLTVCRISYNWVKWLVEKEKKGEKKIEGTALTFIVFINDALKPLTAGCFVFAKIKQSSYCYFLSLNSHCAKRLVTLLYEEYWDFCSSRARIFSKTKDTRCNKMHGDYFNSTCTLLSA